MINDFSISCGIAIKSVGEAWWCFTGRKWPKTGGECWLMGCNLVRRGALMFRASKNVGSMYGRRKFRSETSDNMDRWKSRGGKSQRRKEKRREERTREEERRSEKRKNQKKEDAGARKARKVPIHCVFSMICGSGGSKSRLGKAAGAEPSGQMRDEKLHAVVARSTCGSHNVQNTSASDHFWKL